MMFEKKNPFSRFECFEHVKTFLICVKLWACRIFNYWKIFLKNLWQFELLCFICDLSNIQKSSLKKCPLIWVAPLTLFLPTYVLFNPPFNAFFIEVIVIVTKAIANAQ